MAQKNRTKEIWLIPKRVNLHQTICLIDGIIERNYSGTTWNPQKQNNLGVNLKKWGATNNGKNISPQAIRTLVASIPQYLGFLYINTKTTPNTICITEVGQKLWEFHKNELKPIKNLNDGKIDLIQKSKFLLLQMEKLQITNPIILKDCINVLVFPFRLTLKLLLDFEYIDREELAYILFTKKDESDFELIKEEIKNFRSMEFDKREKIIDAFKESHIGNITLVQAPSAGYFEALCVNTGIIVKKNIKIPNPNNVYKKISSLSIKSGYKEFVEDILFNKYKDAEVYDFRDNLDLWIEYIGNPSRLSPPKEIKIINNSNNDILINILKENQQIFGDLIYKNNFFIYPMFIDEEYKLEIFEVESGNLIDEYKIKTSNNLKEFVIKNISVIENKIESLEDIYYEILEHSNSRYFSKKMLNYLSILYKQDGIDRKENKSLRGAIYELLFFKFLTKLEQNNVIDEVIWNGRVGRYGLPTSAPGGKLGTPDIIFRINDIVFILELTTIRSKSLQFKAEGSSVPDHIKLFKLNSRNKIIGIFSAPLIHARNTASMESILHKEQIPIICIRDIDLLNILMQQNTNLILNQLLLLNS